MKIGSTVPFIVLGVSGYVLAPLSLAMGWSKLSAQSKMNSVSSRLSLIGFLLATVSGLCGILLIGYAQVHQLSGSLDPSARIFFQLGFSLSLLGILFGISGAWRKNPLRWHAPVSAVGTFAFWIIASLFA